MESLAFLTLGIVVGGLLGWLLGRSRQPAADDDRLTVELRDQLTRREADLTAVRNVADEHSRELAAARAKLAATEALQQEQREVFEKNLRDVAQTHDKALADLKEAFKSMSLEALRKTHPEFLQLANETLARFQETAKGDLAQRQESIKGMVEPLKQQLEAYQKRLQQSESSQSETLGQVRKQLELLGQHSQILAHETQQFRMVLKSNQARGRWGEETLRRVVEAAGMTAHCDFTEQAQAGEGKPDLVVRLPGDRVIIVDSKVPDLDFLNELNQATDVKRAEVLATHAARLKSTIKALADRDYPAQMANALDYVVLFLPAESLFSAALEGDSDLIVWAAGKRILLATPASLIALLRSVSVSWQQHAQTENARHIADAARELYGRVAKFVEHFERIRGGLERAQNAYNDAVGSYERQVRPSGERLLKMGIESPGREIKEVATLNPALRDSPEKATQTSTDRDSID